MDKKAKGIFASAEKLINHIPGGPTGGTTNEDGHVSESDKGGGGSLLVYMMRTRL